MKKQLERFWREEDGITALEYGILAAIILVAVAAFALFINKQFADGGLIKSKVASAMSAPNSAAVSSPTAN